MGCSDQKKKKMTFQCNNAKKVKHKINSNYYFQICVVLQKYKDFLIITKTYAQNCASQIKTKNYIHVKNI
jgi:hypothetical protein